MSESNGRGTGGRFANGNPGGPGRPRREVERTYLDATIAAVSVERWASVVAKALDDAEAGDHHARAWLSKVLGIDAPQRLEHTTDGGPLTFAAILAAADGSDPPPTHRTGNVVDVDAEVARIEAEWRAKQAVDASRGEEQ